MLSCVLHFHVKSIRRKKKLLCFRLPSVPKLSSTRLIKINNITLKLTFNSIKFWKRTQKLNIKIILKNPPSSLLFWGNATGSTEVFITPYEPGGSILTNKQSFSRRSRFLLCGIEITIHKVHTRSKVMILNP